MVAPSARSQPAVHLLIIPCEQLDSKLSTIEEALELYSTVKGQSKGKVFLSHSKRNVSHLIACSCFTRLFEKLSTILSFILRAQGTISNGRYGLSNKRVCRSGPLSGRYAIDLPACCARAGAVTSIAYRLMVTGL